MKTLLFTPGFGRKTFNRERQLWLEQNFQNYSYKQFYGSDGRGEPTHLELTVKNETVAYVRKYDNNDKAGPLVTPEVFSATNAADTFLSLPLLMSITQLYDEIERLANSDKYKIYIRYNYYHAPAEVLVICSEKNNAYIDIRFIQPHWNSLQPNTQAGKSGLE